MPRAQRTPGRGLPCEERRELIAGTVRTKGRVRVADLVRELGVSRMTIHRDLQHLDARGLVRRIRSGADSVDPVGPPDPVGPVDPTASTAPAA
ncbi:DeoR family transcriptional regulator [Streptomyces sp. NBC_00335]|uniref:DeoR family transcriptional regulator n=1 Tax=unclassified Streptomyces TaxID=2593676 RepID=UPI002252D9BC|nr:MULTISPECIES: DeoR family transcriptional regulator [unclassified Streptomyces]MCX5404966.1 DeoR family transcriptional regulator [Streptomyces sp. NBC_00086]